MLFEIVTMALSGFAMYMTAYGLWKSLIWSILKLIFTILGTCFAGVILYTCFIYLLFGLAEIVMPQIPFRNLFRQNSYNQDNQDNIETRYPGFELLVQKYDDLTTKHKLLQDRMSKMAEIHEDDLKALNLRITQDKATCQKHENIIREYDITTQLLAEEIKTHKSTIEEQNSKIADRNQQSAQTLVVKLPLSLNRLPEQLKQAVDGKMRKMLEERDLHHTKLSGSYVAQMVEAYQNQLQAYVASHEANAEQLNKKHIAIVEELEKRIAKQSASMKKFHSIRTQLKSKADKKLDHLLNTEKKLEDLPIVEEKLERLIIAEQKPEDLTNAEKKLEDQIKQLETSIAQQAQQVSAKTTIVSTKDAEITNLKLTLAKRNSEIISRDQTTDNIRRDLAEKVCIINVNDKQLAEQAVVVDNVSKALAEKDHVINNGMQELAEMNQTINNDVQQIAEKDRIINSARQELALKEHFGRKAEALMQELRQKEQIINVSSQTIQELTESKTSMQASLKEACVERDYIVATETKLAATGIQIKDLKNQLTDLNKTVKFQEPAYMSMVAVLKSVEDALIDAGADEAKGDGDFDHFEAVKKLVTEFEDRTIAGLEKERRDNRKLAIAKAIIVRQKNEHFGEGNSALSDINLELEMTVNILGGEKERWKEEEAALVAANSKLKEALGAHRPMAQPKSRKKA